MTSVNTMLLLGTPEKALEAFWCSGLNQGDGLVGNRELNSQYARGSFFSGTWQAFHAFGASRPPIKALFRSMYRKR